MRPRFPYVIQRVFIGATVLLISMCTTFILLYVIVPYSQKLAAVPPVVAKQAIHETLSTVKIAPPVTLKISAIDVLAIVNQVGLASNGDMDIDEDPNQLAWYKFGPKPGEEGSAVIAGHYGWKDGVPSIFNNINKLVKGDSVTTLDENGVEKEFIVTRIAVYAPEEDATNVFKSDDGKAHLNLITCQGSWNNFDKTYTQRLIVFTDYLNE